MEIENNFSTDLIFNQHRDPLVNKIIFYKYIREILTIKTGVRRAVMIQKNEEGLKLFLKGNKSAVE